MLGKLNFRLYRLLQIRCDTKSESYRVLILSNIYVIAFITCTLFLLVHLFFNKWENFVVNLLNSTIYAIGIWFIYKRKYLYSKYLIYITSVLAITINASFQGPGNGSFIFLFPIFTSLFIIFDLNDIKHILAMFIFISLSILFLETTNYSYFITEKIDENYVRLNYYFSISFSLVLQFFIVYLIVYSLKKFENKLKIANSRVLKQNNDLVKVNNELDSFVYKASHDLRAPLVSVMGLISIMRQTKNESELSSYMDMQEKSILKLDLHIRDILDLSKNARVEIQKQSFDIEKLVLECYKNLENFQTDRKIELVLNTTGSPIILSDKARWTTILDNVLSNSIKYYDMSKENSVIKVEINHTKEHKILVSVKDNGVGIIQNQLSKVFNMYHRAHSTSFGSGLGLYIVKEMIEKMGGEVRITSEYGQFTQLTIDLPLF